MPRRKPSPKQDDGENEDYWEQGAEQVGSLQQLTDFEDAPPPRKRKRRAMGFCRDIDRLVEDDDDAEGDGA